jgi:hypothetical protein
MKPRGLSIDNINKKYRGTSALHSPTGQVENRVIIGSPVSQIVQPSAFRGAVVSPAVQLAQPSQVIRQSYARTISPVAYTNPSIAYPSLSPAMPMTTTTVRRSRIASVVPGPIVEQRIETIEQPQPAVIKKTVVV